MKILNMIEERDPEMSDRLNSRRKALRDFADLGKKLTMAAVPLAVGSMFQKAYGQSTTNVVDVLNYALTLEYLERQLQSQSLTFLVGKVLVRGRLPWLLPITNCFWPLHNRWKIRAFVLTKDKPPIWYSKMPSSPPRSIFTR